MVFNQDLLKSLDPSPQDAADQREDTPTHTNPSFEHGCSCPAKVDPKGRSAVDPRLNTGEITVQPQKKEAGQKQDDKGLEQRPEDSNSEDDHRGLHH